MAVRRKWWVMEMLLAAVFFSNLWNQYWHLEKEPVTVEVGATTHLKDTSRQKCSFTLSQLLKPFWAKGSSFSAPSQTLEPQHWQALTKLSFSYHHYQRLARGVLESISCQSLSSLSSLSTLSQSYSFSFPHPYLLSNHPTPHSMFYTHLFTLIPLVPHSNQPCSVEIVYKRCKTVTHN